MCGLSQTLLIHSSCALKANTLWLTFQFAQAYETFYGPRWLHPKVYHIHIRLLAVLKRLKLETYKNNLKVNKS